MTPLANYFRRHPERKKIHLARDLRITPGRVSQLCRAGNPGLALAIRIKEWTGGEVRPEDWRLSDPEEIV